MLTIPSSVSGVTALIIMFLSSQMTVRKHLLLLYSFIVEIESSSALLAPRGFSFVAI